MLRSEILRKVRIEKSDVIMVAWFHLTQRNVQ